MRGAKAVGIMYDDILIPIYNAGSIRGIPLKGLIVSGKHVDWYRKHEEELRLSFMMNRDGEGTVMLLASKNRVARQEEV